MGTPSRVFADSSRNTLNTRINTLNSYAYSYASLNRLLSLNTVVVTYSTRTAYSYKSDGANHSPFLRVMSRVFAWNRSASASTNAGAAS